MRREGGGDDGEEAGELDPNLYDRTRRGAGPTTGRPGLLVEPAIERLRRTRGPFASDDDLLLAAFYDDTQYSALKAAGPIDTDYPLMETPLLTLVKEVAQRKSITAFHFTQTGKAAS